MIDFISKQLGRIRTDLESAITRGERLCPLKQFSYAWGNKPDYSNRLVQQYYLLRYFHAYLHEYFFMYQCLLRMQFVNFPFRVLSLGCGCGIDYWGLCFAINEIRPCSEFLKEVYYCGVDKNDWKYRVPRSSHFKFVKYELPGKRLKIDPNYNAIVFPKSILEFEDDEFSGLLEIFNKSDFQQNQIALLCSDSEFSRLDQIIHVFLEKGFEANNVDHVYSKNSIKKKWPVFSFPANIIDFVDNLNQRCCRYSQNNFRSCESDCANMNRTPILTSDYVKFKIIKLGKTMGIS